MSDRGRTQQAPSERGLFGGNALQLRRRNVDASSDLSGMAEADPGSRPTLLGELITEGFGSMVLGLFGLGVVAQVVVSKNGLGGHDSISWAWGIGVTLGIFVAGATTGAHLNPAVTLAVTLFRDFPARRALPYMTAQVIGFFIAALIVRIDYSSGLDAVDPHHTLATQGVFSTLPGNGDAALDVSIWLALFDQIVGTAILLFLVFAITEPGAAGPSPGLTAIAVGLVVVGIGMAFGTDAGYAINPARDFGPRLLEWLTGYGSAWVDQTGEPYFWVPIVGPFIGGAIGGGLYKATVARGLPLSPAS
ncbi:MIP/aquaporin family protein [Amnibacterium sp.]|uniref:MIP/aquaporin family protein n=1 Tax=Amnibacterium sp. TaxID=1872496 RepID=UPI003F7C7B44